MLRYDEMKYQIEIQGQKIEYTRKISRRSRRIRLSVHPGGEVVVTAPKLFFESNIAKFIEKNLGWVLKKIAQQKLIKPFDASIARQEYALYKDQALALVKSRIHELNKTYGFVFNKISIKNHKTLWGSCSRRGNLNFSYKLAIIPSEWSDYIIVHELCHLKEFNHSVKFWELVAQTIPNYKQIRKHLKSKSLL